MSNGCYLKIVMLCCGVCGVLSNFAGGGASKLNQTIEDIEQNGPVAKRKPELVPEVLEMQPLLGATASGAEWVVLFESKENNGEAEDDSFDHDPWLEHMEEEAKIDLQFPTYGAMSSYPQYTAVSRSRSILEIDPVEDEDGVVRFVKNQKFHDEESGCCDRLMKCVYRGLWFKSCFELCGVGYWRLKLSGEDGKYGSSTRNKSGSCVRAEWV